MVEAKDSNKIWQAPWGYPESFVIVAGIAAIGLMLEVAVGSFDFYLLARPANYIAAAAFALISVALGLKARGNDFARWVVGAPLSVALISAMLALGIIMGLTPQMTHSHTLLGFDAMTSNWAFVMLYSLTLIAVGAVIVNRARGFRIADYSFYLNHLGVYLLLLASGLGYSDMQRYVMYVNEGETEWRVYDNDRNIKELPIAISLKDFRAEYYPSKEIYFDAQTGELQKGDSRKYENDDRYIKIMAEPEPRRFSSDVEVYTEQGHSQTATIEVNSPLRIDSWTIYQYGYDNQAGALSSYSSFELVYDSWIAPVYIGVILMMLGSVAMILTGHKTRKETL